MVAGMVNGTRASVTHRLWAQFPNGNKQNLYLLPGLMYI